MESFATLWIFKYSQLWSQNSDAFFLFHSRFGFFPPNFYIFEFISVMTVTVVIATVVYTLLH